MPCSYDRSTVCEQVYKWQQGIGFLRSQKEREDDRQMYSYNRSSTDVLHITTVLSKPHVMLRQVSEDSPQKFDMTDANVAYEGFCMDLIKVYRHVLMCHVRAYAVTVGESGLQVSCASGA